MDKCLFEQVIVSFLFNRWAKLIQNFTSRFICITAVFVLLLEWKGMSKSHTLKSVTALPIQDISCICCFIFWDGTMNIKDQTEITTSISYERISLEVHVAMCCISP